VADADREVAPGFEMKELQIAGTRLEGVQCEHLVEGAVA
jgi:hypothetical protein